MFARDILRLVVGKILFKYLNFDYCAPFHMIWISAVDNSRRIGSLFIFLTPNHYFVYKVVKQCLLYWQLYRMHLSSLNSYCISCEYCCCAQWPKMFFKDIYNLFACKKAVSMLIDECKHLFFPLCIISVYTCTQTLILLWNLNSKCVLANDPPISKIPQILIAFL